MDLTALRAEVVDPAYSGLDVEAVAKAINETVVEVARPTITATDLAALITLDDILGLKDSSSLEWLKIQLLVGVINVTDNLRTAAETLFPNNKDLYLALMKQQKPKYEVLGFNRPLDFADIKAALAAVEDTTTKEAYEAGKLEPEAKAVESEVVEAIKGK